MTAIYLNAGELIELLNWFREEGLTLISIMYMRSPSLVSPWSVSPDKAEFPIWMSHLTDSPKDRRLAQKARKSTSSPV
jgi:hypothetical protein